MKNFFSLLLLGLTALMFGAPVVAYAQATLTLDPTVPGSFTDPGNVSLLATAITTLIAYFSGAVPGLRTIKAAYLRTAVVSLVVVAGAATFKLGFLTEDTFQFVLKNALPNFAYAGILWEGIKFILRLFGIDLKNVAGQDQTQSRPAA